MAGLTFEKLRKCYGDVEVLHQVDVTVADGEYLILVGPSGCGKSTLLRCIAGLEEITSGELRIGDRRVNELAPRERDVAMVFQSYALYPHMTVGQNIGFPLRIRGQSKQEIEKAVARSAEMLGLTPLLDRYPGQLSGGQRQRVAMGRAVVRTPSVFLFDEPLSNLDASLRHQMRVELKRLHRSMGVTIVHVTHDQVEALTLADRILVLERGIVQQVGSPRELFDHPANAFVAQFIGAPSMNLLEVQGSGSSMSWAGSDLAYPCEISGASQLGVRPTDARLVPLDEAHLTAKLDVIESLGAEAMLHLDPGEGLDFLLMAKEPVQVQEGQTVGVRFDVVHHFDQVTGARLP